MDQPLASCRLGPPGPLHQGRVGGRRQLARALHAPLGPRVGLPAQHVQRQRRRRRRSGSGGHGPNLAPRRTFTDRIVAVRVLVAIATRSGSLTSRAGRRRRSVPAGPATDVRVLPVGRLGRGFLAAYADLRDGGRRGGVWTGTTWPPPPGRAAGTVALEVTGPVSPEALPLQATSRPLGEALARALDEHRPDSAGRRPERAVGARRRRRPAGRRWGRTRTSRWTPASNRSAG